MEVCSYREIIAIGTGIKKKYNCNGRKYIDSGRMGYRRAAYIDTYAKRIKRKITSQNIGHEGSYTRSLVKKGKVDDQAYARKPLRQLENSSPTDGE